MFLQTLIKGKQIIIFLEKLDKTKIRISFVVYIKRYY